MTLVTGIRVYGAAWRAATPRRSALRRDSQPQRSGPSPGTHDHRAGARRYDGRLRIRQNHGVSLTLGRHFRDNDLHPVENVGKDVRRYAADGCGSWPAEEIAADNLAASTSYVWRMQKHVPREGAVRLLLSHPHLEACRSPLQATGGNSQELPGKHQSRMTGRSAVS